MAGQGKAYRQDTPGTHDTHDRTLTSVCVRQSYSSTFDLKKYNDNTAKRLLHHSQKYLSYYFHCYERE